MHARLGIALALLAGVLGRAVSASAQSPSADPAILAVAGDEARFSGRINDDSAARLETLLAGPEGAHVVRLRISSMGGELRAGIRLGRLIRARGLEIVVDRICGSACAIYAVPAARRVTLEPDALILFHQLPSPELIAAWRHELARMTDPARRTRLAAAIARAADDLPAHEAYYRDLGVNQVDMRDTVQIWLYLLAYLERERLVPPEAEVVVALDGAAMRDCLGLANGAWPDFSVADSIVRSRVGVTSVGFVIGGRLYYGGREVPGVQLNCARPGTAAAPAR
jgi:hypothetical protein